MDIIKIVELTLFVLGAIIGFTLIPFHTAMLKKGWIILAVMPIALFLISAVIMILCIMAMPPASVSFLRDYVEIAEKISLSSAAFCFTWVVGFLFGGLAHIVSEGK